MRRRGAGFSLLEVMIALAILSGTLVVLLEIVTNNVRATNHAKMTTTATFLARGKMIDIEDGIIETGFIENDETDNGTFKDQGFPQYRWESSVERVELPTDMTQQAQDKATQAKDSKDPFSAMTGMVGGLMGSFIEPIRIGLQESVRRVTLRVLWDENGRPDQTLEVVTFLTDPAKLDLALTGGAAGAVPGAAGAVPGAPGAIPGVTGGIPGMGAGGLPPGVTLPRLGGK